MVYILLAPGFEESEALVPADLLRRAQVEVALVGVEGLAVSGSHGIRVLADLTLEQAEAASCQLLVLPGGLAGVAALGRSQAARDFIRAVHSLGRPLAAICAAPTLLASLGLLDGLAATCYPGMEDQLSGARAADVPVAETETVITGRAAGASFDFALALVERLRGPQVRQDVQNAVHYHPSGR